MDGRGFRLVLPEDGYEWRKYGQKFIKNIGKFRYVDRENISLISIYIYMHDHLIYIYIYIYIYIGSFN
jgi:hypothetical protein